jgi:adenine deaminase
MSEKIAVMTRTLVDVAMGRKPADLVIRNGRWVCVQSGEILLHTDIAVRGERIAYVGPDAAYAIGDATQVIDADDCSLVLAGRPTHIDQHAHLPLGFAQDPGDLR